MVDYQHYPPRPPITDPHHRKMPTFASISKAELEREAAIRKEQIRARKLRGP